MSKNTVDLNNSDLIENSNYCLEKLKKRIKEIGSICLAIMGKLKTHFGTKIINYHDPEMLKENFNYISIKNISDLQIRNFYRALNSKLNSCRKYDQRIHSKIAQIGYISRLTLLVEWQRLFVENHEYKNNVVSSETNDNQIHYNPTKDEFMSLMEALSTIAVETNSFKFKKMVEILNSTGLLCYDGT